MGNLKKNPLSLQLNVDDFLPASQEEKQSLEVDNFMEIILKLKIFILME